MSTKAVLIHGSYGTPDENWFPWLKQELFDSGCEIIAPAFPTPNGQSFSAWQKIFSQEIGQINSEMIFIAHSLGPAFILKMLESAQTPAKATFLVAGFLGKLDLPDFDPINSTFMQQEFNWSKIRHNAGKVFIFASDNDPYVPIAKGEELSEYLQTPLIVIENAGHINAKAGYATFPLLLKELKQLIS